MRSGSTGRGIFLAVTQDILYERTCGTQSKHHVGQTCENLYRLRLRFIAVYAGTNRAVFLPINRTSTSNKLCCAPFQEDGKKKQTVTLSRKMENGSIRFNSL